MNTEGSTSQKLILNTILFAINSFGSRLIVFFLIPLYTHFLTNSQLGVADLVYSTSSIMMSVFSLRISAAVLRFGGKDEEENKLVLSNSLITIIVSTLVVVVLILITILGLSFEKLYLYVPILYFVNSIKDVIAQYCKACRKLKIYAAEGILTSILHFSFAVLFLIIFSTGIHGYILSILLSNAIGLLFLIIRGRVNVKLYSPKNRLFREMLSYSIPLVPNSISWKIIELSDRYMVAFFVSSAANGIYTVAYKIPSMIGVFADIFIQAWLLTTIDEYDGRKDYRSFKKIYACYEAFLFLISSVIIGFNRIIAHLLYSDSFFTASLYAPLLIFALLFNNLQAYFGIFYNAAKKTKQLLYSSIVAAIINIIFNVLLIPRIGVYGAIIATCISYILILFIRMFNTKKFISFEINYLTLILNIVALFLQCLNESFNINNIFRYTVNIILFAFILVINRQRLNDVIKISTLLAKKLIGKIY